MHIIIFQERNTEALKLLKVKHLDGCQYDALMLAAEALTYTFEPGQWQIKIIEVLSSALLEPTCELYKLSGVYASLLRGHEMPAVEKFLFSFRLKAAEAMFEFNADTDMDELEAMDDNSRFVAYNLALALTGRVYRTFTHPLRIEGSWEGAERWHLFVDTTKPCEKIWILTALAAKVGLNRDVKLHDSVGRIFYHVFPGDFTAYLQVVEDSGGYTMRQIFVEDYKSVQIQVTPPTPLDGGETLGSMIDRCHVQTMIKIPADNHSCVHCS